MLMTPDFGLMPDRESFFMENMMRNYFYVFFGGAVGGLLRVMSTKADNIFHLAGMDLTILAINLAGAFLLGLFLAGSAQVQSLSPGLRLGIAVGFFGSFTTFSTFCMESATLLHGHSAMGFGLYVFSSCILGLILVQLGYLAGKGVFLFQAKTTRDDLPISGQQETEGD
jgi:fluoride exporter